MPRFVTVLTALLVGSSAASLAQDYPAKPIRLLVGYGTGGSTDAAARLVAQELGPRLGTTVVVENRDGASGTIAALAVVRAPKDGYTLLFAAAPEITMLPAAGRKMPYDSQADLAPVSLVGMVPLVLLVHPTVPAQSLSEVVALAKAQPGKLNYASFGVATSNHLAMELFKSRTASEITHIPYKGGGPAMPDILAGRVQLVFHSVPVVLSAVKEGRLRAIAFTGATRSPLMPEVPTMTEAGLPEFTAGSWVSLFAPAGTAPAIIERLNREIAAIVESPRVHETFVAQGIVPATNTPRAFARHIDAEIKELARVVSRAGIVAE